MPPKYYYFFIAKTNSIDNYKTTNVFNVLDHQLTNRNCTAIQT